MRGFILSRQQNKIHESDCTDTLANLCHCCHTFSHDLPQFTIYCLFDQFLLCGFHFYHAHVKTASNEVNSWALETILDFMSYHKTRTQQGVNRLIRCIIQDVGLSSD